MKKSFRLPFFIILNFLFVFLFRHSSLFFVHSGFLFGIKERKTRDVFIDTHTHRIKSSHRRASSEREREKKKIIMGKKEVRFVSFRYTTEEKEE